GPDPVPRHVRPRPTCAGERSAPPLCAGAATSLRRRHLPSPSRIALPARGESRRGAAARHPGLRGRDRRALVPTRPAPRRRSATVRPVRRSATATPGARRDTKMETGNIIRALACALLLSTGRAAAQEPPPRLTLDEVYALARERSPLLRAAHFAVEASRAREDAAGLPPDPTLEIGAMNLSLPGLAADMPASMAPQIQVMQTLPFPGTLRLARRIAALGTGIARADADEAWWEVRSRVATAFYDIYEVDARIAVLRETLELLRSFQAAAR